MTTQSSVGRLRLTTIVASVVLIGASLVIGLWPVTGIYDSESFSCGSAFLGILDDKSYEGTEGYSACIRERSHLRWIGAGLFLGAVLGTAASASGRRSEDSVNA